MRCFFFAPTAVRIASPLLALLLAAGCGPATEGSGFGGGGVYDPSQYIPPGDDDDDDSFGDDDDDDATGGGGNGGSNGSGSGGSGSGGSGSGGSGSGGEGCGSVTADWPESWSDSEEDVLEAINAARAAGADCGTQGYHPPAPPLSMNECLGDAARLHAEDMGLQNYFSHVSLDGRMFSDRIQSTGYGAFRFGGENIAAGYGSAYEVVAGWLQSDGHCHNLMDPNFSEVGTAYYYGPNSDYFHVWVQNFATPF